MPMTTTMSGIMLNTMIFHVGMSTGQWSPSHARFERSGSRDAMKMVGELNERVLMEERRE